MTTQRLINQINKQNMKDMKAIPRVRSKFIVTALTFITAGMIIGSMLQLAFLNILHKASGNSHWKNDKEALELRLGLMKPEVLSWDPRIILFHNFLSMEECDYLRTLSKSQLETSLVIDPKTGKGFKSEARTSSGMFIYPKGRKDPIIQAVEQRIAVYSQVPPENGEFIQVLRYEPDQYYLPHHDTFKNADHIRKGGQRVATMLMYLSDNVEGGETHFPKAGNGQCSCGGEMVEGLCVKPTKGDAVLFWSLGLNGKLDPKSIHEGCAVLKGEKWSATKWMRERAQK